MRSELSPDTREHRRVQAMRAAQNGRCDCGAATDIMRGAGSCSICHHMTCSALCGAQHHYSVHERLMPNKPAAKYCLGCYGPVATKCSFCGAGFCGDDHLLRHLHNFHAQPPAAAQTESEVPALSAGTEEEA